MSLARVRLKTFSQYEVYKARPEEFGYVITHLVK